MALPEGQPAKRYVALDGLRGIAAISVVLFHLRIYGIYPFTYPNHAVDLFFIMSGFVIANVYEKRLPKLGFREFMKRRLLRLYPTYALALTILPLFTLFLYVLARGKMAIAPMMISIPFQALYLPSPPAIVPVARSAFMLDGPAWSLFWEILINAVYALALGFLTNRVLLVIVAGAAAWLMYLLFQGISLDGGSDWATYYVGAARVMYGFPLGVLIYRCPPPKIDAPFWTLALLCLASLFLPSFVSVFIILPLVVWLATGSSANHPALERLGLLSYPLYAIHIPLTAPLLWMLQHLWKSIPLPLVGWFDLLTISGLAWLVATRWDLPVRNWLERRFAKRRVATSLMVDPVQR